MEDMKQAGLNFILPFGLQQMHRLPKDIQVLELTNYPNTATESARREKAAHIQTSDGFFVDVDVSILYRIVDPYKVFTTIGPGMLFEDNGVIPKTEPVLKATLGELTTEAFYVADRRELQAEKAKDVLQDILGPMGIIVEKVLTKDYRFNREYQKAIEDKKVADQRVEKHKSAQRAALEEYKRKLEEARGEVNQMVADIRRRDESQNNRHQPAH